MKKGYSFIALSFVLFSTSCIYIRMPSFKVKIENQTSIPDSSLKIVNSVKLYGTSYFKSFYLNHYPTMTIAESERTTDWQRGNVKTLKLDKLSLLKQKEAVGEISIYKNNLNRHVTTIEYNSMGIYKNNYEKLNTGFRPSIRKQLILKELTIKINLPEILTNFRSDTESLNDWLKYKCAYIHIKTNSITFDYTIRLDEHAFTEGSLRRVFIIPTTSKNEIENPVCTVTITGFPNEINLIYNKEKNAIEWTKEGLNQMQTAMVSWLVEHQKYALLKRFLNEKDLVWNKELASKMLVIASTPNYGIVEADSTFEQNNYNIVKFLLNKGANPNATDLDRNPIIAELVLRNSTSAVKELVNAGANINLTHYGKSLLEWAEQRKNKELIDFFMNLEKK